MMNYASCLTILSVLLLSSCAKPEVKTVTQTEYVKQNVPLVSRPRPVVLSDPNLYVVTKDNMEEFIEKYQKETGETTFIAMSVSDYEKIVLNVAELRRFIEQQEQIIVYYEGQLSE